MSLSRYPMNLSPMSLSRYPMNLSPMNLSRPMNLSHWALVSLTQAVEQSVRQEPHRPRYQCPLLPLLLLQQQIPVCLENLDRQQRLQEAYCHRGPILLRQQSDCLRHRLHLQRLHLR
jgi:hypothetical protein